MRHRSLRHLALPVLHRSPDTHSRDIPSQDIPGTHHMPNSPDIRDIHHHHSRDTPSSRDIHHSRDFLHSRDISSSRHIHHSMDIRLSTMDHRLAMEEHRHHRHCILCSRT